MSKNPWKEAGEKLLQGGEDLAHHTEEDVRTERHPHQKVAIAMSVVGLILFFIGLAPFVSDLDLFKASVTEEDPLVKLLSARTVTNVPPVATPVATPVPTVSSTATPAQTPVATPTPATTPASTPTATPSATPVKTTTPSPTVSSSGSGSGSGSGYGGTVNNSKPSPTPTAISTPKPVLPTPAPTPVTIVSSSNSGANPNLKSLDSLTNNHTGAIDNGAILHNAAGDNGTGGGTLINAPQNAQTGPGTSLLFVALCFFGAIALRYRRALFSWSPRI